MKNKKFNLFWRHRYKVGSIKIHKDIVNYILLKGEAGQTVQLAPRFTITTNQKTGERKVELLEVSIIPDHKKTSEHTKARLL